MKILLLGEFSALHKNLKEGLQELGHEAVVAATGDGFKKIAADISFESRLPSIFGKVDRKFKPAFKLKDFKNYDVVQLINPFSFSGKGFPSSFFYNQIKKNNDKFFMLGAGSDAFFWQVGRDGMAYGPFNDTLKYDLKSLTHYYQSKKAMLFNEKVVRMVDGVIPIMYEYEVSYAGVKNRQPTIPIPINTKKIVYKENVASNKLVVFHGLNRYGFKGTRFVEEAFSILKEKYPNDLELVIKGNMPLNEYLELMQRTNVVIDQVNSYSCGVNAVYALAMGKVVLGGAEPESLKSLGVTSSPVINVKPSVASIVEEIEKLLEQRDNITTLGFQSRQFAEQVHGYVKVAQQYVDIWSKHR